MDELFEALTLIQTNKVRDFPVVLYGADYWKGLLDWIRGPMLEGGKISEVDLDLIFVADDPESAVSHVIEGHKAFLAQRAKRYRRRRNDQR